MPIFTYRCQECGEGFDLLQSFKETDEAKTLPCPREECGGTAWRVPTTFAAKVTRGTPLHYPNRKENR